MAFGKRESYGDDLISYTESVDMLLNDLKAIGYNDLTKNKLNEILQNNFSIGRAVRTELDKILGKKSLYFVMSVEEVFLQTCSNKCYLYNTKHCKPDGLVPFDATTCKNFHTEKSFKELDKL